MYTAGVILNLSLGEIRSKEKIQKLKEGTYSIVVGLSVRTSTSGEISIINQLSALIKKYRSIIPSQS